MYVYLAQKITLRVQKNATTKIVPRYRNVRVLTTETRLHPRYDGSVRGECNATSMRHETSMNVLTYVCTRYVNILLMAKPCLFCFVLFPLQNVAEGRHFQQILETCRILPMFFLDYMMSSPQWATAGGYLREYTKKKRINATNKKEGQVTEKGDGGQNMKNPTLHALNRQKKYTSRCARQSSCFP